jgi:hypothetical protein
LQRLLDNNDNPMPHEKDRHPNNPSHFGSMHVVDGFMQKAGTSGHHNSRRHAIRHNEKQYQ